MKTLYSGKVRDIYAVGEDQLLLVTSDRISAFDVVMDEPVVDKGRVLTAMSAFWFGHFADLVPNHLVATDLPAELARPEWAGRAMLCRRAEMLPIECIVRGHLTGSAWKEYRSDGTMHGAPLPAGIQESEALPEPVFTPSTKAEDGLHDENISFAEAVDLVGSETATRARDISLELYRRGSAWAAERGIIIADTKFELGMIDGELAVCDEVLTPDSSRFWPADQWAPGATPPSFDKQPVRDFLDGLDWDKSPPPPALPVAVVDATRSRYVEAYERITGLDFAGLARRMTFDVLVEVSLRPGIADPEGATIERALPTLGFAGVEGVRVGKAIRFTLEADDEAAAREQAIRMADEILGNPVIEDAAVTVSAA